MISKYDHLIPSVKAALPDEIVPRIDDNDCQRALIARNGDVMEATALLQKYAHIRLDYPKLYEKMTIATVLKVVDGMFFCPVYSFNTKDDMAVFYYDAGSWDPSVTSLEENWAALFMLSDLWSIIAPEWLDPGYITIMDLQGVSLKHMKATNPRVYGRAAHCFYESGICCEKKNYNINSSLLVEMGNKASRMLLPSAFNDIHVFVKKEKLIDIVGEDVIQSKKYVPTPEDREKYKKLIKDNLPILIAKYEKMML